MSEVHELVLKLLEADPDLPDDEQLLVMAAMEGDEALAGLTEFTAPTRAPATTATDPAGAFLSSITVQGFRGIGPATTLPLKPGPGLTVIAGRNGSGKSSIAEALEVALTRTTHRWATKQSVQWEDGWRNLHADVTPSISVTLAEEQVGTTTISVTWPDGSSSPHDPDVTMQRRGEKREQGLDSLGWTAGLESYRPILSYDELGTLMTGSPSQLYDALARVLGLDEITDALKRLEQHSKTLRAPEAQVRAAKKTLIDALAGSLDDRAANALKLVKARTPDIAAMRTLATGVDQSVDGPAVALRTILQLQLPAADTVSAAANELRDALDDVAGTGDAAMTALQLRSSVFEAAVHLHAETGDQECPVCRQGQLDHDTVVRLRDEVSAAQHALGDLRAAHTRLSTATASARRLIAPGPELAVDGLPASVAPLLDKVVKLWAQWSAAPESPTALADHLETHHAELLGALTELKTQADRELAELNTAWAGLAAQLGGYAQQLKRWLDGKPDADKAKAAYEWLKAHDTELKNERIRPLSEQASEIWQQLRQQSNVEFHGLELTGSNTRRRVDIRSAVDGEPGSGLAVLSQGELHALALALFLPRATLPQSPFRFVVLDDPVQAMDPAKVDGLVSVLNQIARTRQVVVFSHDDRLATAVRRNPVNASIVEVRREASSTVHFHESMDPPSRYLSDAFAMTQDSKLPEQTLRKLLPTLLRLAVEAQARDRYFTTELANGASHADLERSWEQNRETRKKVALAVYGEVRSLDTWLQRMHRRDALGICTSGAHGGLRGDAREACRLVRRLMEDIKDGTK